MNKLISLILAGYSFLGVTETTTKTPLANKNNKQQEAGALNDKSPVLASAAQQAATRAPSSDQSTAQTSATAPIENRWWGDVELRPSWATKGGVWDTENTVELGYKPKADRLLAYTQYFATALYNPKAPASSPTLLGQDGFFRYKMANLWVSDDKTWSFAWEPRIYLPTDPSLRADGLITYTRQYLSFSKKLRENVTLTLMQVTFLYGYATAGSSVSGLANPIAETREYILLDASLFSGFVNVSMNILINHQLTRDYAISAMNNNRFVHKLWTWPEIDFNVAPHTVLGISYYSDNFVTDNFSKLTLADGLEKGVVQLVVRASL